MDLFRFIPGYTDAIYHEGKEPLFLLILAFIVCFALTRGYTRIARVRGWGSAHVGEVHVHHVVPGIMLVLAGGLVVFTRVGSDEIVRELCGIAFGIGAAFVLDEFALVFYLRDVYWSGEGRSSVDATILGLTAAALCLHVSEPFGLDDPVGHSGRLAFFAVVAANLVFAVVTVVKGKPFAGMAAIVVPLVGLVGAIRLARAGSPWARRFYDAPKIERARRRAETDPGRRFRQRLVTIVGGEAPSSAV